MTLDPSAQIAYVREATSRLLAGLGTLTAADLAGPSLCPGWTVGHVLTHIARSGDGLRRSIEGARRGELVPMYDGEEARAADIEAGAKRSLAELTADIERSARLLDDTWSLLDEASWHGEVLLRMGRRPVHETPVMRWREVEIHRVDLAGAYGPSDWPAPFVAYVLDATVPSAAGRLPAGVAVELRTTDTGDVWCCGAADARRVTVTGPSWALAAWLLGRPDPAVGSLSTVDGDLPALTAWL